MGKVQDNLALQICEKIQRPEAAKCDFELITKASKKPDNKLYKICLLQNKRNSF